MNDQHKEALSAAGLDWIKILNLIQKAPAVLALLRQLIDLVEAQPISQTTPPNGTTPPQL